MTPDELQARLSRIGDQRAVTRRPAMWTPSGAAGRDAVPAAVLVPVVLHDEPTILLTKRTSHLKKHAGQVSFPGGRIDPEDTGPEAAALREAWEEIGLPASSVAVLGRLEDQVTGTGFRITPVLATLPPALTYQISPDEVDAIFELPMSVVLDPAAPRRQKQEVGGVWREYWVWPHPDHFIWGATAAILVQLAERLRKDMRDA
ncbi:MAG TPA: CoA pyrophosphatase [Rhodopila sp.]|uniref:CoA pyrophosphatase n=1 Tax=Rhodopila sp. TaxID=2480087 RepID=UPI002BA897C3|nr:CoA pyrophosphatase [Rhodopila sp.]HVY16769.1 CoA pyrophosphatase [Rhodopila sp.]